MAFFCFNHEADYSPACHILAQSGNARRLSYWWLQILPNPFVGVGRGDFVFSQLTWVDLTAPNLAGQANHRLGTHKECFKILGISCIHFEARATQWSLDQKSRPQILDSPPPGGGIYGRDRRNVWVRFSTRTHDRPILTTVVVIRWPCWEISFLVKKDSGKL